MIGEVKNIWFSDIVASTLLNSIVDSFSMNNNADVVKVFNNVLKVGINLSSGHQEIYICNNIIGEVDKYNVSPFVIRANAVYTMIDKNIIYNNIIIINFNLATFHKFIYFITSNIDRKSCPMRNIRNGNIKSSLTFNFI